MPNPNFIFRDIPLEQLESDPKHWRFTVIDETEVEDARLLASIREYGLLQILVVNQLEDDRYQVIDGHRRYACARQLGLSTIPCRVHVGLDTAEVQRLRFALQNTVKPWTQAELATVRRRIKQLNG